MPDPVLIGGIAQGVGQAINAVSTGIQNKKNREWQERMYQRQFDDNLRLWHLQNEYNSPFEQMKRFQEAGLNPALVYGQSASGASGNAQLGKGASYGNPSTGVPTYGSVLSEAIPTLMAYYDVEKKKAEVDNLKVDNTIKIEDHLLRRSQRKRSEFDLSLESELRQTSLEARKESLRRQRAETDTLLNRDEREAAMNAKSLEEAGERITQIRLNQANTREEKKRIIEGWKLLQKDNTLKRLDIELRDLRINPNDPLIWRILGGILDQYLKDSGKQLKY